ncbi:MAG: endonuclease/exonuclease/phosphatase family protein, partial [Verrucomicrobia bacterium]|nr:endonuclease/exonuclease/phosphatase family protein [Verrucomicrobiota bacterium]
MYHPFSGFSVRAVLSLGLIYSTTLPQQAAAQSNVNVRIMAANLNGQTQSIQPFEINIYKGLKPDVMCVQEFNYNNNTAADFRALVDDAFGTNFSYFRESASGLQIPNGIISRYPIIASGRWVDTEVSNRGFAWARIDLPGSNDLYAVSVHLLTSSAGNRATEANNLKALIQANFPANAWIVIGGDFNTTSRTETAITTLASVCLDKPVPTDAESGGNDKSNNARKNPYDYVLISAPMTNYLTNVVFASHSFSNGLVFDSRVYTPLSDVSPVISSDSSTCQHMAILKDFSIPAGGSNAPVAPIISTQPQSQTVAVGGTANFNVAATGTTPLAYQWRFNGTNISGALTNTYTLANAQTNNNG